MPNRRQVALGAGIVALGRLMARPLAARAAQAAPTNADPGVFAREMAALEAASGGRLGVAVHDTGTGRRFGHRGGERFPLCSTFKVLACGAVLARVDAGREDLARRVAFGPGEILAHSPVTAGRVGTGMTMDEICEAAMTQSDNTAANLILASLGGPAAVTAFARAIGDPTTRLDRSELALNEAVPGDPRDTTTPDAMAADLRWLVLDGGLSQRSRDRIGAWMVANRTGDAKLRAGVPAGWRVGDRTGGGDRGSTNDVAVVWPTGRKPVVVCVYLTETTAAFDARNATIAAVGRAVAEFVG